MTTGRRYRGLNWLLLSSVGFATPWWLTFREAATRGGAVRRGETGTPIVFWKIDEEVDDETGELKKRFLLRHFTVFNLEQTDGVAAPSTPHGRDRFWQPLVACERIWTGWAGRPLLRHGGNRASYAPLLDQITLPPRSSFGRGEDYYATLFHESIHATGHSSRLDRKLDTALPAFGSPDYSREELVAEMGSAFLCSAAGIDSVTIDNSASYLAGWIRVLRGDSRLVVTAAAQAQKAADHIHGLPANGILAERVDPA